MVATGWYASFPAYDEDADVMADDETGGAGAKEPPQKSLSLPGRGQGEGPAEAVSPDDGVARPTIIVARHVILWDRKIVSWEQMVLRFRTMRADGPIHPQFKFTNGAIQDGAEQRWQQRIFKELYKELFEPAGMSIGSMSPRAGDRLDRIQTADDLRSDPARRIPGRCSRPRASRPPIRL